MQIGQIAIQQAITPLFGKDLSRVIAAKLPASDSPKWRTLEQEIDLAIRIGKSELSKKVTAAFQRCEQMELIARRAAKDADDANKEYDLLCAQLFKIEFPDDTE